jgi:hypothetical protein
MGDKMLFLSTRLGSRYLLSMVSLVVLLLTLPVASTAQCPTNTVSCVGENCCGGEQLFNQTETSTGPTHSVSYNQSTATYDLTEGTLYAKAQVDDVYRHRSRATVADVFELHNVPAAMLKIRLNLLVFMVTDPSGRMAWVDGYARLTVGSLTAEAGTLGPHIDPFIELDVAVLEGVPFQVTYETVAAGWGYYPVISMTCQLEFVDLPDGAEITSCNGYGTSLVPVEQTTWGAIKAQYQ